MTAGAVVGAIGFVLLVSGFFGPISVRVRSLFFKHSRTGNPLVDSVAEHQPASAAAYWQYLQQAMYLSPIGLIICFFDRSNASLFLILYGFVSYYFAQKMNRLIILMGPIASALSGIAVARISYWAWAQLPLFIPALGPVAGSDEKEKDDKKPKSAAPTPLDKARTFYRSTSGKTVRQQKKNEASF